MLLSSCPAPITTDLDHLPIPDFSDYYKERDMLFPDYEELYRLTETWREKHQILSMLDKGDKLTILDTRIIAEKSFRHISFRKQR